jgi:kynurenine 3-monooxygenase
MSKVAIIGAGLAGSLLAIYLARRGFQVDVFEARGDMRNGLIAGGRSINLALSDRGIAALREVGMDEYMLSEAVPMYGRMIHSLSGDTKLLPYSGRKGEYINSVSRAGLNIALINEAEKYDGVQFIFDERCVDFDFKIGEVTLESGRTVRADTTIATDGAGSAVRHATMKRLDNFEITEKWLEHGYKELHIPPSNAADSPFLIEPNALHIWPRHRFMMIALPNFDGSFTCTLFLDHTGGNATVRERASTRTIYNADISQNRSTAEPSFDQLTNKNSLLEFFSREFPDAVPLMPTLVNDFFHNPTGNLGTVKCWPWSVEDKVLLLGDSAHAMVPFYGQGMNCAFEDVRVLDQLIKKHGTDWQTVYSEYGRVRKPNADAIADMAEENFYEMRDATADRVFQRKRELETKLEQTFPDYFSKYSMVTFREDLPYAVAKERGNEQDRLLMNLCAGVESVDELDLQQVMHAVRALASSAIDV